MSHLEALTHISLLGARECALSLYFATNLGINIFLPPKLLDKLRGGSLNFLPCTLRLITKWLKISTLRPACSLL